MPIESIASQLPVGAGRFADQVWPDPQQFNGFQVTAAVRSRVGFGAAAGTSVARSLAVSGGTNTVVNVKLGVACAAMQCTAAGAGTQFALQGAGFVLPKTTKSNLGPWADDESAYRIVVNMCGNGQAVNSDFGFQLVQTTGLGGFLLAGANVGIGLQIADSHVIQLLIRGPNGLITVPITAAPFDTTIWHSYQLEIVSATPTDDASFSLFIDQAPVALSPANSSWGAGSNLPPIAAVAGQVGFMPTMVCVGGVDSFLFIQQLHVMSAPSILMTQ